MTKETPNITNIVAEGPSRAGKTYWVTTQMDNESANRTQKGVITIAYNDDKELTLTDQIALKLFGFDAKTEVLLHIKEINNANINDESTLQYFIRNIINFAFATQSNFKVPTIKTIYWDGTNNDLIDNVIHESVKLTDSDDSENEYNINSYSVTHKLISHKENNNPLKLQPFTVTQIELKHVEI